MIGIHTDGESRAYVVADLSHMTTHIVNDVLGGSAVSVTYCDRTDVARVFGGADDDMPVNLSIGGWKDSEMLVMLDGKTYPHRATDIPLKEIPFQRTTWGEWKRQYPETTIYTSRKAAQ